MTVMLMGRLQTSLPRYDEFWSVNGEYWPPFTRPDRHRRVQLLGLRQETTPHGCIPYRLAGGCHVPPHSVARTRKNPSRQCDRRGGTTHWGFTALLEGRFYASYHGVELLIALQPFGGSIRRCGRRGWFHPHPGRSLEFPCNVEVTGSSSPRH